MNIQEMLMQRIRQYDFALKELNLYLDSHPDCKKALDLFAKYKKLHDDAVSEYSSKFGPITPEQSSNTKHWSWIDDPWPWERS